jgi:hypothetical protein
MRNWRRCERPGGSADATDGPRTGGKDVHRAGGGGPTWTGAGRVKPETCGDRVDHTGVLAASGSGGKGKTAVARLSLGVSGSRSGFALRGIRLHDREDIGASRVGKRTKIARSKLVFLVERGRACSSEHMRYLRRLFTLLRRGRARPQQLELPFHIKGSRRGALLETRRRAR